MRSRLAALLACLAALALGGCASMGPPTIARDRFDYVSAVSDSWKQQMLLNLLKVRYFDAPVFMDVASVINSYSLEGEVTFADQAAPLGVGPGGITVGGGLYGQAVLYGGVASGGPGIVKGRGRGLGHDNAVN